MGGILQGLLSAGVGALSNVGNPNYAIQIRQHLEERRNALADLLSKTAAVQRDSARRAELYQHTADLYSGKPIGGIAQGVAKTLTNLVQDHQKLGQVFPEPIGTMDRKPATGEQSGPSAQARQMIQPLQGTPGATGGMQSATPSAPPLAAAPGTSPVQPVRQQAAPAAAAMPQTAPTAAPAAIPPIQPPVQEATTAEATQVQGIPNLPPELIPVGSLDLEHLWFPPDITPAEVELRKVGYAQAVAHNEALRQQQEALRMRQWGLQQMQGTLAGLPPMQRAGYEAQSYGLQPVMPPAFAMRPVHMGSALGSQLPQGTVDASSGSPVDPNTVYERYQIPMTGQTLHLPKAVADRFMAGMNGEVLPVNPFTAQPGAAVPGAVNASTATKATENSTSTQVNPWGGSTVRKAATSSVIPPVTGAVTAPTPNSAAPSSVTPSTAHSAARISSHKGTVGGGNSAYEGLTPGSPKFARNVQTAVSMLMTPNLSNAQVNEELKILGPEKSPLRAAVTNAYLDRKESDSSPLSWDVGTAEAARLSNQALTHIDNIFKLIDNLDAGKQLGPVMSRWNDFWTGHIGADLTSNQDYVKLKNQIGLLTKVMGRIHGGARGGGSIQMIENFKKDLSQEKMDAPTLRGALSVEKEWLQAYANPSSTAFPKSNPVGGGGSDMVTATLPDGTTGQIHASQKANFLRDHPGAKVQ